MVKSFAFMMGWELFLILASLTIMGAFAQPMPAVLAVCTHFGTNPFDLSVAIFIIGSIIGVFVMCLVAIIGGKPWK